MILKLKIIIHLLIIFKFKINSLIKKIYLISIMNKIKKTIGKDGKIYYFKNGKRISKSKFLKFNKKGGADMSFRFKNNPVDKESRKVQSLVENLGNAFNTLNNNIAKQHNKIDKMLKGGKKKRKKRRKKQKGGGSDWMTVVRSRGPSNYPGQKINLVKH